MPSTLLAFATGMKKEVPGRKPLSRRISDKGVDNGSASRGREPKSMLSGKSHSTGSSGFTIASILPSVGKRLGMLGQKVSSDSPVYTSSTNNIGRTGAVVLDTKVGAQKSRLSRSQSVRAESRLSSSRSQQLGDTGTGSKAPLRRHKSASSVDRMAEHFAVCSSLIQLSDKMVVPGSLGGMVQDLNNNMKGPLEPPLAEGTVRKSKKKRRERIASQTSETGTDAEIQSVKQGDIPSQDKLSKPGDNASDHKATGQGERASEDKLSRRGDRVAETKAEKGQERERVAELKEAQDRVTRRRTPSGSSKRDRSRSKDRSRRKSTGADYNLQTSSNGAKEGDNASSGDVAHEFADLRSAAEATDSGLGPDTVDKYQLLANHYCDNPQDRDFADGDAEMIARATKALHEHVKDVRATCCVGKPPVKKESFNNHINAQYHGGTKDVAYSDGQLVNNNPCINPSPHYHQDKLRSPPAYSQNPPPPYSNTRQSPRGHSPKHSQHYHGAPHGHKGAPFPSDTRAPPPPVLSPHGNNIGHITGMNASHKPHDPHQYIVDENTGTTYVKGRLLGKGGFAKCYELTDVKTNKTYAGKIISKNRISKPHQKEKILREIELHKLMKHRHVVAFHSYFEDSESVYIILENCSMKSLVHVLKCRKTLTEPEVRYHMRHLVDGCRYIHNQRVIHRDLKLGNMLLNDKMQTKIADFGLATRVEYEGEKKMTVCGTPNYIAPEVLQKKGHSYEADIWALGCIMYAMLVGKPPFETATLKETYMRITANKYFVPPHVSRTAKALITRLLSPDPGQRPTLEKILSDEFFISGHLPRTLPTSCCETPPKFGTTSSTSSNVSIPSRPRSYAAPVTSSEAMQKMQSDLAQFKGSRKSASQIITKAEKTTTKDSMLRHASSTPTGVRRATSAELQNVPSGSAIRLYQMLTTCLEQMPQDSNPCPVQVAKQHWVTKWVDYSNKYGFGFQLSDKSVGILFNDTTRMLLGNDGKTCQYNDLSNKVYTFTTDTAPEEYQKKVTLLLYFAQYMDEHLIHGGDMLAGRENVSPPTGIFMKKWFRTGRAIVMYLSNGTLQVNFFEDHTKVILSPDGQDYLATYINTKRQAVTYRLLQFRHFGCHPDIQERLRYSRRMLESIINIEGEAV